VSVTHSEEGDFWRYAHAALYSGRSAKNSLVKVFFLQKEMQSNRAVAHSRPDITASIQIMNRLEEEGL